MLFPQLRWVNRQPKEHYVVWQLVLKNSCYDVWPQAGQVDHPQRGQQRWADKLWTLYRDNISALPDGCRLFMYQNHNERTQERLAAGFEHT